MCIRDSSRECPVYQVEDMDSLKLGSAEFNISNYFIRNEYQYQNHYYIDSVSYTHLDVYKRQLHYYDTIGLFSPDTKGDNGYRYYNFSQSIDFEYIRMLKDLNMSIEEIQKYLHTPDSDSFIKIAESGVCK